MLNLMNTTFPPKMALRPNPPLLSIFRISLNQACLILTPPLTSPLHHSPPITPSGSNPCVICTDPMDKSLQVTDSLVGLFSPPLKPRPPPVASDVAPTPTPPLGSHLMLTRVKVGIFKTRHTVNLSVFSSSGLLSTLLASTEPKGFKYAAKNSTWLATMMKKFKLYNIIVPGF